jgi:uncharacterized BrkB/YihY/UPF0761 family membrane protein
VLVGASISFTLLHSKEQWLALGGVSVAVALWVAIMRLAITLTRKANRFYGVSRDSRKSFWQRKGDDLIVALFSGIVGAVLGVAGTLFVQAHTTTGSQNRGAQSSPAALKKPPANPS